MTWTIITERTLLQRINRKLRDDRRQLCKSRNPTQRLKLGSYFVADDRGAVVSTHCDLFEQGVQLGVVRGGEKLAAA